eukprot:m.58748 g.58748  ORF g.58748 m.58748 type:complete len:331 (+) comp13531_c0_seq1:209-1201(+)
MSRLSADDTVLSAADIVRLRAAGLTCYRDLLRLSDAQLATAAQTTQDRAREIQNDIAQRIAPCALSAAQMLSELRASLQVLSTGCSCIDELLGGGLLTGQVTEIVGSSATGKTQLCFSAAANVLATSESAQVVFIDSGSSTCIARVQEILRAQHPSVGEECLGRLRMLRVFDADALGDVLQQLAQASWPSPAGCVRLLVIDSVASILAPAVGGQHTQGHALLASIAIQLKQLAQQLNIAVLMTNYLVSADRTVPRPALGVMWASVPHTRVLLASATQNQTQELPPSAGATASAVACDERSRLAILVKSSVAACGRAARFYLGEAGVQNSL